MATDQLSSTDKMILVHSRKLKLKTDFKHGKSATAGYFRSVQGGLMLPLKQWDKEPFLTVAFSARRGKPTTNVSADTSQVGKLLQALHYVWG